MDDPTKPESLTLGDDDLLSTDMSLSGSEESVTIVADKPSKDDITLLMLEEKCDLSDEFTGGVTIKKRRLAVSLAAVETLLSKLGTTKRIALFTSASRRVFPGPFNASVAIAWQNPLDGGQWETSGGCTSPATMIELKLSAINVALETAQEYVLEQRNTLEYSQYKSTVNNKDKRYFKIIIYSDSVDSLESVQNFRHMDVQTTEYGYIMANICARTRALHVLDADVELQWAPPFKGIEGNKRAYDKALQLRYLRPYHPKADSEEGDSGYMDWVSASPAPGFSGMGIDVFHVERERDGVKSLVCDTRYYKRA